MIFILVSEFEITLCILSLLLMRRSILLCMQQEKTMSFQTERRLQQERQVAQKLTNYKIRISPKKTFNVKSDIPATMHMKNFARKESTRAAQGKGAEGKFKLQTFQIFGAGVSLVVLIAMIEFFILPVYRYRRNRYNINERRVQQKKTVRFD